MAIGYACIVLGVPGLGLKSCTARHATEDKLRHITIHNLWALSDMIDYNTANGIELFRISSDIIPFGSHPLNRQQWWQDNSDLISSIGRRIRNSGIRVSMHPGQYTVLNSPDCSVVERAIADLSYHARFLDALGVDCSNKIILHIGGVYGNKLQAVDRFIENCRRLPDAIKSRLALENDEKCYNIADVLVIADELSLPVVFDNLHHSLNLPSPGQVVQDACADELQGSSFLMERSSISAACLETSLSLSSDLKGKTSLSSLSSAETSPVRWIERCRATWKPHDGRQKIHYSQQMAGGKPGAHSLTIDANEFITFYSCIMNKDTDIMLEVKDKNLSALKCMQAVRRLYSPVPHLNDSVGISEN